MSAAIVVAITHDMIQDYRMMVESVRQTNYVQTYCISSEAGIEVEPTDWSRILGGCSASDGQ